MKKERTNFLGLHDLAWIGIVLVLSYVLFKFGIGFFTDLATGKGMIPIPSSITFMYMGIVIVSIALYLTIDTERMREVFRPVVSLFRDYGYVNAWKKAGRIATLTAVPLITGYYSYLKFTPNIQPPSDPPGIHFDLPGDYKDLKNPLEWTKENIREGGILYVRYCTPCHGDVSDGKGFMARGMTPKPANFREAGTIAQVSENYMVWRIKEGGIGLHTGTMGYRSIMPSWKNDLTDDEIWKISMFAYRNAGQIPANVVEFKSQENPVKTGKEIYEDRCFFCHGMEGDGKGPSVDTSAMNPLPRDFTKAEFMIRTTPHGALPTDADMFKVISKGMPGTTMPALEDVLSEEDRHKLVEYVKTFSERFKKEGAPKPISTGSEISVTPANVEKGKELFKKTKCFLCHGEDGRANGTITVTLKNEWGLRFTARDLTKGLRFKAGNTLRDIYVTITTGFNGTPMGSYADILTDEERWNLAAYVKSLSGGGEAGDKVVLSPKLIQGEIPMDTSTPIWEGVEPMEIELAGQMVIAPRKFTPTIDSVRIKAVYNDKEIAFLLEWNDSTNAQDETFRDTVAIQFSVKTPETSAKPHLAMGGSNMKVNIWRWKAFWDAGVNKDLLNVEEPYIQTTAENMISKGYNSLVTKSPENQYIGGRGSWSNGKWQVVMKRMLNTGNNDDVQFEKGDFVLFSLAVWDGSNGDIGSEKSISTWYYVTLEKATPSSLYLYTLVSVIMAVSIELWFVGRVRRTSPT